MNNKNQPPCKPRWIALALYGCILLGILAKISIPIVVASSAKGELPDDSQPHKTVLAFGGDVNLIDGSYVMPTYRASGRLSRVLTGGLLKRMRTADVLTLNNEFTFSRRGTAQVGKPYTFRASPKSVKLFTNMGVDVAFLGNNHVFDYGPTAFRDTLRTLDKAGIHRIGAGMNVSEAARPVYRTVNGKTIAYVGAGCIERYSIQTPGATKSSPGIFRVDENHMKTLTSTIQNAAINSDYVTVNIHWGREYTTVVEDYQRKIGRMCIDAGADVIIGSHPHILQGTEFYKGKPIVYSIGNFWFNTKQNYTFLMEIILDESDNARLKFLPCSTGGGITRLTHGNEAAKIRNYYEDISFGVHINKRGVITPNKRKGRHTDKESAKIK